MKKSISRYNCVLRLSEQVLLMMEKHLYLLFQGQKFKLCRSLVADEVLFKNSHYLLKKEMTVMKERNQGLYWDFIKSFLGLK